MDLMWRNAGLDLRPFFGNVLPTGSRQGYIEVVPEAVTITQTQKLCGGALSSKGVLEWLKRVPREPSKDTLPPEVVDNYCRSLAGYCVATYVLGIGDRHCSNMMIREDGRFFHIDFGHFLGHFKSVFGINREDRTFYDSEALEEVLTSQKKPPDFHRFCRQALNVLRENSTTLMYLLLSMIGTGVPELQSSDDVQYLGNVLMLDLTEKEAWNQFKKMRVNAKKSMRKVMSDFVHRLVH
jgi:hypothetical protein